MAPFISSPSIVTMVVLNAITITSAASQVHYINPETTTAESLRATGQLYWENIDVLAEETNHTKDELMLKLVDLQKVLEDVSTKHNTSFSMGIHTGPGGPIGAAGGVNNHLTGERTTTTSRFPVGSVTKPFTVAYMMQFYEKGMVDIDAPIYIHVDPVLERLNQTTMLKLWNGDAVSQTITARMLMGMRGGLHDYNDSWYYTTTVQDPKVDVSPFDLLHRLNKSWVCEPGTCGEYASTGFELLGLALMNLSNITTGSYTELDQFSVLPPSIRESYKYTGFPGNGPCTLDPDIVHQYTSSPNYRSLHKKGGKPVTNVTQNITISDLIHGSCLNGWTCGNIAASPVDIARFHSDLHHGNIVNESSLDQMMTFVPMTTGWSPQPYGLGLMHTFPYSGYPWPPDVHNQTFTIGHAGADYGSLGMMSGWNTMYKFGISLVSNSIGSLNCSMSYNMTNPSFFFMEALCPAYDAALSIVSGGKAPRLNCSTCPACPSIRPVEPPSPTCVPLLEHLCGNATATKSLCAECVFRQHQKVLLHNCTYAQEYSFCNITRPPTPAHPTDPPSPPVACKWEI
eukprot:m.87873 g.87873  ORF g.87873 m.87873 type:complete len:569 (+) comp26133_c0_seq1:109-1815(+)